jgi:(p)ppGpp synthase/HD superfamily hydrolase
MVLSFPGVIISYGGAANMKKTGSLAKAIRIAAVAHEGQLDRAGEPYALHPLRVMMRMQGEEEKIVAALHDVVEASEWTLDMLRAEGFSERVVAAVDALSRRIDDKGKKEKYEEFVLRACENPLARKIKEADLLDNMDVSRLPELGPDDLKRVAKHHRALLKVRTLSSEQ